MLILQMDHNQIEIKQYEAQLEQVQLAASTLSEGEEKKKLKALEADLLELISLSRNSFEESQNDPLSEEYNLFKAELQKLCSDKEKNSLYSEPQTSVSDEATGNLKEDLENLKGTKCQAPFKYKWTNDVTYYNALITHVPELDQVNEYDKIYVRVMFINPTHTEMLPCPYYLEGKCRFSDEKCRYSHGELVSLSSLKEYRDPDFSNLYKGCKVLAKQDDGLWYRATVINLNDSHCTVNFESNSKEELVFFHNILPLVQVLEGGDVRKSTKEPNKNYSTLYDENTTSDEESDVVTSAQEKNDENLIRRILSTPPGSALGEWEKFTKGFGSKIMAKMGYVHGSGLGKNGMGRVEPISAVILPTGKSLDHCMMLKEKAGNDKDLFKVERKLKHLQRKHGEKLKKAYEAEKEKTDIFTFLNTTLHPSASSNATKVKLKNELKNETTRNLNVTGLQVAEELRKIKKEIRSLNQSLARHSPHTRGYNVIKEKLALKENKVLQLHASERKIMSEQHQRRDRKKLTEF